MATFEVSLPDIFIAKYTIEISNKVKLHLLCKNLVPVKQQNITFEKFWINVLKVAMFDNR